MKLQDSGSRREFESGAVRDIADDKGRCDLLPLGIVGNILQDPILEEVEKYVRTGIPDCLSRAILWFCKVRYNGIHTALLEVSKHYADGAKKYADRNWEKGIPLHCYIDSGIRHYIKFLRGDTDEPHDRAFLWNMLGALWTQKNKPELIDLPFGKEMEE